MAQALSFQSDPVRTVLEQLIASNGDDYQGISRMIGRNPAYIQQFLKRGTPRRLAEEDRSRLARYFGVDETALGGRASPNSSGGREDLVAVPNYDVGASAGHGSLAVDDQPSEFAGFDPGWLRRKGRQPANLSMVQVTGDSMEPELKNGDSILVDQGDVSPPRSGAIYVIRHQGELKVKRLEPGGTSLVLRSENPRYHPIIVHDLAELDIIGRVICSVRSHV